MSLTLYISSNCKSPTIYDFEFFLRVRSQSPAAALEQKNCMKTERIAKIFF